jgi:glutaredoxin
MSVVVITRNPKDGSCMSCKQVKKFLERGGIPFEEIMFDGGNPQHEELIGQIGVRTVPIILPKGVSNTDNFFVGFDINKLRELKA